MKKFMFAAMAVLAITGCSQNEEMDAPSQKTEVGFNSAVGKVTRATEMLDVNFDNFKVYGYNTGTTGISTVTNIGEKVFMPGIAVNKSGNVWTNTGTFYWPLTDNIQFFAYSPEESTAVANYAATTKYPTFDYTVNGVATQEDLLVAVATDKTKTSAASGVNLGFKHILTQINFSAKGSTADYKYTVTKIELVGVNSKATFTFADGKNNTVGAWGAATIPTATYTYDGNYALITGKALVSFSTNSNALMLMPQTLPTAAEIQITYSVTDDKGGEIFSGVAKTTLKDTVWGTGNKIRYTLELQDNGSEVSFIPEVDAWDEETSRP